MDVQPATDEEVDRLRSLAYDDGNGVWCDLNCREAIRLFARLDAEIDSRKTAEEELKMFKDAAAETRRHRQYRYKEYDKRIAELEAALQDVMGMAAFGVQFDGDGLKKLDAARALLEKHADGQ